MQLSDRIGRRLKLHDLHVLMAVVQAGSMGKAAVLLNTTQPAVSKSVADLERAVGVRLLDRSPHGVLPTEYGRALLAGGTAAFDELRQAVKNIEFFADPTAGDVRVGSIIPLAASFVSAVVDSLSQRYPRIVFHVEAAQMETLSRELNERNLDLLIAPRLEIVTADQFGFEILYKQRFVVLAGIASPWAKRRKIELAELVNESWALPPPDRALGPIYQKMFRASGLDYPSATVITASPEIRLNLLNAGRFLSVFPAVSPGALTGYKVLPVDLPIAPVPVGIITLKNRSLGPVARLFIKQARDVAKSFAKEK
jgi:DNA-binding transcriptional LysR family regulator